MQIGLRKIADAYYSEMKLKNDLIRKEFSTGYNQQATSFKFEIILKKTEK